MSRAALLLAASMALTCTPAHASEAPQAASVRDAERALVASLAKQDRAAFERLLDPDAVFFLPSLSQGREAILKTWVIFLLPTNATMALTPADAVVAGSQDLAYTTGTYLFSADNNGQRLTVMSGTYLAVWRLAGGKWMLKAFTGASERAPSTPVPPGVAPPGGATAQPISAASLANGGGLGPYRFGMLLEDVRKVDACAPYIDVRTTGGLECPNFTFEGRKINVSFIFTASALRRIQLWIYEGESEKDTRKALDFAIDFLRRTAGGAHMYGLPPNQEPSGESIVKALKKAEPGAGRGVMTEVQTPSSDAPEKWYARQPQPVAGRRLVRRLPAGRGAAADRRPLNGSRRLPRIRVLPSGRRSRNAQLLAHE